MRLDLQSEEFRRERYETYRRLRLEAPVCRTDPDGYWAIAKYEDVQAILKNPRLFASAFDTEEPASGPKLLLRARSIIGMDPPDHARLRSLISKAFIPPVIRGLESSIRDT